jgi:hypothetical protein
MDATGQSAETCPLNVANDALKSSGTWVELSRNAVLSQGTISSGSHRRKTRRMVGLRHRCRTAVAQADDSLALADAVGANANYLPADLAKREHVAAG